MLCEIDGLIGCRGGRCCVTLGALAIPLTPAKAQVPYLGVDFDNAFGVGIGAPPSAYGMAPVSPIYPYYYPPRPYYYRY
jgi:hypothetical protein